MTAGLAGEIEPDDGIDPRRFFDRHGRHEKGPGRKARQLCEQVGRALSILFPGLADESLQNLTVVSVEPAPHTGRLQVTVVGATPADATDRHFLSERLARAAGRIRTELAATIHRRKMPELVFRLLLPAAGG